MENVERRNMRSGMSAKGRRASSWSYSDAVGLHAEVCVPAYNTLRATVPITHVQE